MDAANIPGKFRSIVMRISGTCFSNIQISECQSMAIILTAINIASLFCVTFYILITFILRRHGLQKQQQQQFDIRAINIFTLHKK